MSLALFGSILSYEISIICLYFILWD